MRARGLILAGLAVGLGLLALRLGREPDAGEAGLEVEQGSEGQGRPAAQLEVAAVQPLQRADAGERAARAPLDADAQPQPGFGAYQKLAHTLNLKLVGPGDEPIGARIEVLPRVPGSRAEPQTKFVKPGQWTRFELPDPIPVLIRVAEYPPNYLPPVEAQEDGDDAAGFALEKRLSPGANSLVIRLCAGASIEGLVTRATGEGLAGLRVGVQLYGPGIDRVLWAETGQGGRYLVRCQPGLHRVRLELGRNSPFPSLAKPFPVDLRLEPGRAARADFILDAEAATIAGQVVDPMGRPYAGLQVTALHRPDQAGVPREDRIPYTDADQARAVRTLPDGTFALAGLPAGRFGLLFGPNLQRRFGGQIQGVAPFTEHELRAGELLDLGTLIAERLEPAKVDGTVELRGSWKGRESEAERLELVLIVDPSRTDSLARMLGNAPRGIQLPLAFEEGALRFGYTGGLSHLPLFFELSGPGGERVQRLVEPNKTGITPVLLRFPAEPE